MSPQDTTLCQQGIDLYNAGQKLEAYKIFGDLYDNGNDEDITVLFWLAYATTHIGKAELALETIERLEPDHPKLPELRERVSRKQQKLIRKQQKLMMQEFPPAPTRPKLNTNSTSAQAKRLKQLEPNPFRLNRRNGLASSLSVISQSEMVCIGNFEQHVNTPSLGGYAHYTCVGTVIKP